MGECGSSCKDAAYADAYWRLVYREVVSAKLEDVKKPCRGDSAGTRRELPDQRDSSGACWACASAATNATPPVALPMNVGIRKLAT
jgi:hypothetical protein